MKGMVGEREFFPPRPDWRETPMVSKPLDDKIDFYNPLTITWYYGPTADCPWYEAGQSSNQVYVTLGTPQTAPLYHTLVHLACSGEEVQGKTVPSEAVSAIWNEFKDNEVKNVNGMQLRYYNPEKETIARNTTELLKDKNKTGECRAWAELFIDVLKVHGISSARKVRVVEHFFPGEAEFLLDLLQKSFT